jgi:uncharacterized damage-inducible protein DinB
LFLVKHLITILFHCYTRKLRQSGIEAQYIFLCQLELFFRSYSYIALPKIKKMDTLNQLWLYNNWANQAIIQLFTEHSNMPADTLRLFSHIVNTQSVWLSRLHNAPQLFGAWDEHSIVICKNMHEEASAKLYEQIQFPEIRLSEVIRYQNSTGKQFENTRHDILIHVFNHGTYHRAQIATEMRKNNLEPLNTDYITFRRS